MYTIPITYTDLDDVRVTDNVEFNLTKTELLEYVGASIDVGNISADNDKELMENARKKLLKKLDFSSGADIVGFIKDLVLRSYGVRSEDGKSFIKILPDGTKLADKFVQSLAFDELMSQLTEDPTKADEFMFAIMPRSIAAAVKESQKDKDKDKNQDNAEGKKDTSIVPITP